MFEKILLLTLVILQILLILILNFHFKNNNDLLTALQNNIKSLNIPKEVLIKYKNQPIKESVQIKTKKNTEQTDKLIAEQEIKLTNDKIVELNMQEETKN